MNDRQFSIDIRDSGRPIVAIDQFTVHDGCTTFLFGESGIGKSLLSKAIYGLIDTTHLSVAVNGRSYDHHHADPWTQAIRNSSFFVFQEPSSHLDPLLTIRDQLSEGSLNDNRFDEAILTRLWEGRSPQDLGQVLDVFPKPFRPSGGEKQRVLLAMAFKRLAAYVNAPQDPGPSFFVFDEPTGSLDNRYRNIFLEMLFGLFSQRPFTSLVITHDYSIISEICRRYPQLLGHIRFKELSRIHDHSVAIRDFSAQDYLQWIDAARPPIAAASFDETVLHVEPRSMIFNRHLCLYSDKQQSRPAPLIIKKGVLAYIKAPSGVGKTTIAKIIMGLYPAQRFSMELCGMHISEVTRPRVWQERIWGKKAGMVFQHADEALDMQATVWETFKGLPGRGSMNEAAVTRLLQSLFEGPVTHAFLQKKAAWLSGGQKQRLNLLRTLALNTDLIILDEPLNGLDFESVKKTLAIIEERRRAGAALLMISHNEEIFEALVKPENVYYLGEELSRSASGAA